MPDARPGTRVCVDCPTCTARCRLLARYMHVDLYVGHDELNRLCFDCPVCEAPQRVALTIAGWAELAEVRTSGELPARVFHIPDEWFESKPGPPLTVDDLLDFISELGTILTCKET